MSRDEKMAENAEKRTKKRKAGVKRVVAAVTTLILVAAAVLIFIYRDKLTKEYLNSMFSEAQTPEESEAFTYETGTDQVFARAGAGIAVASSSGMQLLDGNGKTVCRQVVSMSTPAVQASKRHAAFYDVGGTVLRVAGFDGSYTDLDTQDAIISVTMNASGWMAVATEKTGYKGYVEIYNASLEPVYEWYSGSGYILSAVVAPDNKGMAVLCAGAEGGRVVQFTFSSEEPAGEFLTPDELLIDLHYLRADQLCALSESRIVFFDDKSEQSGEYLFNDAYLTDYEFGGDGFITVLLSRYRSGNAMVLASLNASGEVLGVLELQRDLLSLSAEGKQLLVLYSDGLTLYSSSLEEQSVRGDVLGVKRAVLLDRNSALLLSAYSAEPYQF
jgi:hypothetical protein